MTEYSPLDLTGALPCADNSVGGVLSSTPAVLGEAPFLYIGRALSAAEFVAYVAAYDFGKVLPSQIVIHNTYLPDASYAPVNDNPATKWDRNEAGLSDTQIMAKRKRQLDQVRDFYAGKGWDRGPHLFVDERWIWLFTPMYEIGIHAAEGNSYTVGGKLRYSIGIETVGYFVKNGWPASMQALLRTAVQALQKRLGTFQIRYISAPQHHPILHDASIAFHRDYNKDACPGPAISPAYAIPILTGANGAHGTYVAHGLPIYHDSQLTIPSGRYLETGKTVTIDRVASEQPRDYARNAGHVADANGGGFVDMTGMSKQW